MSHPPPPHDDDARDPHLLAALRHAPDRDLAPPAQLTAAILRHAQHAVDAPRSAGVDRSASWRSIWARLWQPAPMAAFGSVAMAVLIGVMWGGRDVPEATPDLHPEQVAAAAASKASVAPVPAAAPAAPAVVAPPVASTAELVTPSARTDVGGVPRPARESRRRDLPEREAETAGAGKRADALPTAPLPAAPVAPPPPTPALAQAASPAAAEAREQLAPGPEARRDALARALADAVPSATRPRSEQATLGAAMPALASPLAQADAELDAALRGDPTRVRWRVAGERLVAHEAAQRDWWSALVRATQGRWRVVATASPGTPEDPSLVLLIHGAPRGSLGFEPQALVWRGADGVAWRAPMPPETLREWQAALARW